MKEIQLDKQSPDIAEENIQKLKALFPEIVTEGKVDFEKLQQVLGEYVEDSDERYNFSWNGKGQALRLSQTPSLGTLRPCKDESKDWHTTQNLYIEGDNLEVLKLLQKSYHSKVKMIYIDPPYNTGKDFVYKDDFHDSLENYKRITGQVDSEGNRVSTNTEASGRYHTDWLNMMYPRLRLARNLLTDDGVIFISIDDNEVDNLKKICNEVFGEDNFLAQFIWKKRSGANDAKNFVSIDHEYILCYSKYGLAQLKGVGKTFDNYKNPDNDPRGDWTSGDLTCNKNYIERPNLYYAIVDPKTGITYKCNKNRVWRTVKEKMDEYIKEGKILFPQNGQGTPMYKRHRCEVRSDFQPISSLLGNFLNANSTKELRGIIGERIFDYPKSVELLKIIIGQGSGNGDIILDFFSGSSTTAHAVMQLNAEDGGKRKFIMVQLPEPTDEKSEAYKAGYKNICEIGKERIRRAGEKIKEENKDKENIENLDIGFKVLKLDTSNIRKWQPDYNDLERSLLDHVNNYVEGRTELDVVYEIMLKYGLDMTYPVEEFTIAGKKVYSVGLGMLMICLDDEITAEIANGILEKIKQLKPEGEIRVVFKDNGFKTDSNKTNIKEILKSGGIEEFITL